MGSVRVDDHGEFSPFRMHVLALRGRHPVVAAAREDAERRGELAAAHEHATPGIESDGTAKGWLGRALAIAQIAARERCPCYHAAAVTLAHQEDVAAIHVIQRPQVATGV